MSFVQDCYCIWCFTITLYHIGWMSISNQSSVSHPGPLCKCKVYVVGFCRTSHWCLTLMITSGWSRRMKLLMIFRWEHSLKRAGISINTFLRNQLLDKRGRGFDLDSNQPLDTRGWRVRGFYLDTKRWRLEVLVFWFQLLDIYFVCLPLILRRLSITRNIISKSFWCLLIPLFVGFCRTRHWCLTLMITSGWSRGRNLMLIFRWEQSLKSAGVSINTFLRNQPLDTRRGRRFYLAIKRRRLEVLVFLFQLLVIYFVCLLLILRRLSTPKVKPSTTRSSCTSFFRCCDHLLLLHFASQLLVFYRLPGMKRFASIWCTWYVCSSCWME